MVDKGRYHRKKIVLIYDNRSSFVERDIGILSEHFEVIPLQYRGKKDLPKLTKSVIATDFNVSWFALGYATSAALLSKIFGKKSIIIAGGWDVVSMPEINYGAMLYPERVRKIKLALDHASKVLAVSGSIRNDALKYVQRDIEVVYHGFNPEKYSPKGKKENLVITVGNVRHDNLKRKGLEPFVRAAKYLPDVDFVLIGGFKDDAVNFLKSIATPNVKFTDFVSDEELLNYYHKAKVYVQVSAHEGFGCSLAEAMLCECIPVVTRRGAIPEVVGEDGFYAEYGNVESAAEKIKEALSSNIGTNARQRIVNNFHIDKRRERLRQIVEELAGN